MTRAQHGSFTIERVYDAPVALVFRAWADKEAKALLKHFQFPFTS